MKILFFSPYYFPYISGVTTYPFHLFDKLKTRHTITVLTFQLPETKRDEMLNGIHIVRMPYLFKVSKGFISPQSILMFYRYAKQNDIVMLNMPNVEGVLLAIIARLLRKRVMSIFHCDVILGHTLKERMIEFILRSCVYIQLVLSNCAVGYTQDYVESRSVTQAFRKKFNYVLPPVPSLPSSESDKNEYIKLKGKSVWIGFVGRTAREKGLEHLVDAAMRLQKKYPTLKLMFAGPYANQVAGEEEYYNTIINKLAHSQIPYQFLGSLSGAKLKAFYQSIDILALPSVNQTEAFGMVQVEAMLCGTPVVASNLPGVRVPVQLTGMGEIVAIGNSKHIASTIDRILSNRHSYVAPSKIKQAERIFSLKNTVSHYNSLLET